MTTASRGRHVLMVTDEYPPDTGGVGRSVRRLARSLCGAEYAVSVAVLEEAEPTEKVRESVDGPIRVTRFGLSCKSVARQQGERAERMMRFLDLVRRTPFDLIHAFFPTTTGIVAGMSAKTVKIPFLASFRGNDVYHGILGRHLQTVRWIMEQADYVTFVNGESADLACAAQPRDSAWEVIRNGVAPIPRDRDNGAPIPSGDAVIGISGVFRSKKGMDCLFRACSFLRAAEIGFRLLLVGDFARSEKEYWQKRLREEGLDDITTVTGFVSAEDVQCYLNEMDIFVYPTLYDGCPNSLLEAASAGMPIIASRTRAITELLREDVECLMHAPEDPNGLAACVQRLLADDAERLALGREAQHRAREAFTLEGEERQWRALYRRLIG
jgi:L-malate glycosyltransferase